MRAVVMFFDGGVTAVAVRAFIVVAAGGALAAERFSTRRLLLGEVFLEHQIHLDAGFGCPWDL